MKEQFPIPNNPHDLWKKRVEVKKEIKNQKETQGNQEDSSLDSLIQSIDSLIQHNETSSSEILKYLEILNQEAKKYTQDNYDRSQLRQEVEIARNRENTIPQVQEYLKKISETYDKLLTFKYKDYKKKENEDGVKHVLVKNAVEESFEYLEKHKQELFEEDAITYRSAEILQQHKDLVEHSFVNTQSRQEDYEWLVKKHAEGNPAILLHGPPGTGKTEYVRHFAQNFLDEVPVEMVGKPDMRTTELSGQMGLRPSKEVYGVVETFQLDGIYDKAKEQAKRLGRAVIHFDEIDITTPAVRMWFKPKYKEMKELGITLVATGNLNAKSGRSRLDSAELREFAKKEVSYMPKEEFFDVALTALCNKDGVVPADPKELEETLKYFVESVATIQRDFTEAVDGNQKPILHENVIDTGTALRLLSGFSGGSLYSYLSKEITEMIQNTPQTDPKDKKDMDHMAKIFAQNNFNIPHAFPDLQNKIKENAKRLSTKSGYTSLQDLSFMDPYKLRNIQRDGTIDIQKDLRKEFLKPNEAQENFEKEIPFKTIREQTDNFVKIATQKGIPLHYANDYKVDADIFNYLPHAETSPEKAPQGTFTPVDTVNGTTESKMLETAQKMSLSEAIQYFTDELEKGTFDTLKTYRIIFLTNFRDADGKALKLDCGRRSDGKLILFVNEVSPDDSWDGAGLAWLATKS